MADIDIVPKKRTGTAWLWIVLAIVAAVLIMWMLMGRSPSRTTRSGSLLSPVAPMGWSEATVTT
jgi:bacteriorhodopsin